MSKQFLYTTCSPPCSAKRRASDKDLPVQQIGDVTKALEVLLYCLELDRGIVSHSEFDPNAEFEANDPRGRLFASSKGRSIIAESLKQVVQSR